MYGFEGHSEVISSPGQSPGRVIILLLALALALASASVLAKC